MAFYTTTNRKLNSVIHSSRGGTYIVGSVTILVVVLMLFLAVLPAFQSITDQIENNNVKAAYLAALDQKRATMDAMSLKYDQYKADIDIFNNLILTKNDTELVVANMNELARQANVTLLSINFEKVTDPKDPEIRSYAGLKAQPFNITFKGQVDDLVRILKVLEKSPLNIKFDGVSFSRGVPVNDNMNAHANNNASNDTSLTFMLTASYFFWETNSTTTTTAQQ